MQRLKRRCAQSNWPSNSSGEAARRRPESMKGIATLSGGAGGAPRQTRLRATSTYILSPVEALWEQALHGRVQALSQSFAYWLERKWGV